MVGNACEPNRTLVDTSSYAGEFIDPANTRMFSTLEHLSWVVGPVHEAGRSNW